MNPIFVAILRCPETGEDLRLVADEICGDGTVKTEKLVTGDGTREYPIVNFIPRFVDKEHYASSFGYE